MKKNEMTHKIQSRRNQQYSYSDYINLCNYIESDAPNIKSLPSLKVAILRNFTVEPLLPVIKSEIFLLGFRPELYVGNFDAIALDVLNGDSEFFQFKPDIVILDLWLDGLAPKLIEEFHCLSEGRRQEEMGRVISDIEDIIIGIKNKTNLPILINNFPLPSYASIGIFDSQESDLQVESIINLNRNLLKCVRKYIDVYIVNFMTVFARIGSFTIDERYWHIARAPLGRQSLVAIGQEYSKFFRALKGKRKKCLVLDCDNTLWGGIIGEEGLNGIKLGNVYPGSCYQSFQREILNLYNQGVILALCSKNNESEVIDVLRNHPDMILREEHFAAWQLNWDDKATNLVKLAQELNIGLDSMIFADDNPFEAELIIDQLPEVEVLNLSGDPSTFRLKLLSSGYFDSLTFSKEDKVRTEMYLSDRQRKQLFEASTSLDDYLRKLNMVAGIGFASNETIGRIAQLTQKTNQFNLTTKRYIEGELKAYLDKPEYDVFYIRLRDKIAELGIIGVAIIHYVGDQAIIDTLLLSCRALGRKIEEALLAYIIQTVSGKGYKQLIGLYTSTSKNIQVANFYEKCGFELLQNGNGRTTWVMDIKNKVFSCPPWITVERI